MSSSNTTRPPIFGHLKRPILHKMDSGWLSLAGRSLLQSSDQVISSNCKGAGCFVFSIIAVCLVIFFVGAILLKTLLDSLRYRSALRRGKIPATMLVTYCECQMCHPCRRPVPDPSSL